MNKKIYDYEDFENIFKNLIPQNSWCLDIGSNIGRTVSAISKILNGSGKIICFEPINELRKICENKFIEHKNIDFYSYACDDQYCEKVFSYGVNNSDGNGGIWDGYGEKERGNPPLYMKVKCIDTADFLIKTYGMENLKNNLKFIKIDCEGHDYVIIKNLKPIIEICKPIIFCEWWFTDSAIKLFNVIEEINYLPYRSDDSSILANKDHIGKGLVTEILGTQLQFLQQSRDLILIPNF